MARHKKKNKLARYLIVFKRRLKGLNRKKADQWFRRNLKGHPFILGFLLIKWIESIFVKKIYSPLNPKRFLLFHFSIFFLWLVLVILSNALQDKHKVKWYLRKRFVFFMLVVFSPLGIIFLWSGSQFKRITKIIFTVIFSIYFIALNISYSRKYEKFLNKPPFESIVEMVTKPKENTFLKRTDKRILHNLRFKALSRKKNRLAVSEIAARSSAAIVSIETNGKDGEKIGLASGFVISEEGVIVTNFHVIESAYGAKIKIGDDTFKEVYLIESLPELDISLLKIDAKNLPALPLGDSDKLVDGEFIVVLSNPWGFERSISSGIISAIRSKGNIKLIQMTAPVSPGSSGGPVINEYGEVVGIATLASLFVAQNLNFAIPINYLNKIIKRR